MPKLLLRLHRGTLLRDSEVTSLLGLWKLEHGSEVVEDRAGETATEWVALSAVSK